MKNIFKQTISFFVAAVMLITMFSIFAYATKQQPVLVDLGNGYYKFGDWEIYSHEEFGIYECDILSYNGTASEVTIPDEIAGLKVTFIDDAFENNKKITKVNIPDSVEQISGVGEQSEGKAFYGCVNLKEVNLPSKLKVIGDLAFYGCEKLNNLNFPKSLRFIGIQAFGKTAFSGKVNLKNVSRFNPLAFEGTKVSSYSVSSSNEAYKTSKGVLYSKDGKVLVAYPPAKKEKSFIVKSSITSIENFAFARNRYLEKVTVKNKKCKVVQSEVAYDNYRDIGVSDNTVVYCRKDSKILKDLKKNNCRYAYTGSHKDEVGALWFTKVNNKSLRVNWAPVENAEKYRVYVSTDGKKWKKARTVLSGTAKVKNLKPNKKYYFRVCAVIDGKSTSYSDVFNVKTDRV